MGLFYMMGVKQEMYNILLVKVRNILRNIFKRNYKNGYFTHTIGSKKLLCKILNEYENEEEAKNDLVDLLMHKKTEKELLKEFLTKKSW